MYSARFSRRNARPHYRLDGGLLHVPQVRPGSRDTNVRNAEVTSHAHSASGQRPGDARRAVAGPAAASRALTAGPSLFAAGARRFSFVSRGAARRLAVRTAANLARRLQSRGFDLVHAHDARTHTLGALGGLFASVPLVVSRRVAFPVRKSAASRWKYSRAALYLAVSQFVARQLRVAGVEEKRIRVVYHGRSSCPK